MDRVILKNILSMFSIQGINYFIPLIMVPYLVRTLGLDGFGKYSIVIAIIQYLVIITDYGFNLSASREIALNIDNKKKVSEIFFSIITCKIILAGIAFFILAAILSIDDDLKNEYILFLSGAGIVIGTSFFPVWLYQGYERMHWIAISNLIAKLSGLIFILIFVNNASDLLLAIIIQSFVSMVAATIAFSNAFLGKYIYLTKISIKMIKEQLVSGWSIFLSTFFVSMYTTSIPLILGYNAGAEAVGIYNAADKLKYALQGIIGPISQAIYPRTNKLMQESVSDGLKFVTKITVPLIIIMLIFSIIISINAELIVSLIFGIENSSTYKVLQIIIWTPPIIAIANALGVQIMLSIGLKKQFGLVYVIIGLLGLPLMYIGSYIWSYIGVSFVTLLIEILITLTFMIILLKKRKKNDLYINMHTNKR
ncbi:MULTISPECIES: flippase [unclassified Providencia]|uniref:flippase n=1 Tax=unclassified Providencia TaxID=2633465 RepID=UPI0012B6454F|nr:MULTISPECIES: flippase [unclassified Providencia]MTB39501.1 oligosaccharide flippase family protein [Providencia sp. wls1949]